MVKSNYVAWCGCKSESLLAITKVSNETKHDFLGPNLNMGFEKQKTYFYFQSPDGPNISRCKLARWEAVKDEGGKTNAYSQNVRFWWRGQISHQTNSTGCQYSKWPQYTTHHRAHSCNYCKSTQIVVVFQVNNSTPPYLCTFLYINSSSTQESREKNG